MVLCVYHELSPAVVSVEVRERRGLRPDQTGVG